METLTPHTLEPELAAPPPRRLRLAPATSALSLLALLLFALFFAGGMRALWEAGRLGWIAATGQTVPARIVAIAALPPDTPGNPPQQTLLRCSYPAGRAPDARQIIATIRLDAPAAPETTPLAAVATPPAGRPKIALFHIGDTLNLRRAHWFGHAILIPWPAQPGPKIAFLTFCGLLIVAVSFTLSRRLWRWARRRTHLLTHGIATVGTVVFKHSQAEDAPQYTIRYGYGDRQTPPVSYQSDEQVTPDQWKTFQIGQPVTVLYDPQDPANSGLYPLLRG